MAQRIVQTQGGAYTLEDKQAIDDNFAELFAALLFEIGGDAPLRIIGGGQSIVLTDTPTGGALYGEDIGEIYSLGAWDPFDGSGLVQRFLYGMFQHLYANTIVLANSDGSDYVEPVSLGAIDSLVHLGGGRAVVVDGTITAVSCANLATAFASLPTGVAGMTAYVTDSNTDTWGATIAGGDSKKVLAFFNGTNWTVAGK